MVRSTHYLRIIEEEHLVENAGKVGATFWIDYAICNAKIHGFPQRRGRGLFLAFDLPDAKTREEFWKGFFDLGVSDASLGREFNSVSPATRHHSGGGR